MRMATSYTRRRHLRNSPQRRSVARRGIAQDHCHATVRGRARRREDARVDVTARVMGLSL